MTDAYAAKEAQSLIDAAGEALIKAASASASPFFELNKFYMSHGLRGQLKPIEFPTAMLVSKNFYKPG
eukprot:11971276-Ditylum_brightwellii.AAC.1